MSSNNYKIFIASSNKLETERDKLRNAIADLDNKLKNKNASLEVVVWENIDPEIVVDGMQSGYNKALATCDVLILMYWGELGKFTQKEYKLAFELLKERKIKKIYVFEKSSLVTFELIPENVQNLIELKAILNELDKENWPVAFDSVDTICRTLENGIIASFEDENNRDFLYGQSVQSFYGNIYDLPEHYLGREDELVLIKNQFDSLNIFDSKEIAISGEGGLGKTTLITKYLLDNQYRYKYFIFLFCENGILTELEKLALLRLPNYHDIDEEQRLSELTSYLNNLASDKKCIFLFDNVNNEDHWKEFKKHCAHLNWEMLVSTRVKSLTKKEIELYPLPEHQAIDLFYSYYSLEERSMTEPIVRQLLIGMYYNTLLIEVFAQVLCQMNMLFGETLESFIIKFKEKGIFESVELRATIHTEYNKYIHKSDKNKVGEILDVMYDISGLTTEQKEVLQAIALFPTTKHKISTIIDVLEPEEKLEYYNLLKTLGAWISIDNTDINMKDLVQEMILHTCNGQINDMQNNLLVALCDRVDESINDIPKIIQIYAPLADGVLRNSFRISKKITDERMELTENLLQFEKNVLKSGDNQTRYENYKLFIETQEAGKGHSIIYRNLYEEFVEICIRNRSYDKAIEYQKLIVNYEKETNSDKKTYALTLKKLLSIYISKHE